MALDIKQFAAVARATNAIHFYVTTDAIAAVVAANYFSNKDLSGSVKVGDIVLVNASDKFAILKVTAVTPASGAITVVSAFTQA